MEPRTVLSVVLAGLLAWPLPAQQPTGPRPQIAQPPQGTQAPSTLPTPERPSPGTPAAQAPAAQAQPAEPPGVLKIVVVEGEGAVNNIRTRSATAPVVEVRDENDKPVAGAEVIFQLPPAGPGGVFHGWMRTQTVRSDENGRAAASGYAPNDQAGRFNIKVTATLGNRTGSAVISQTNVYRGGGGGPGISSARSGWWKILVGVGAAGAVIGAVAATRGNGTASATTSRPITITPGPITVGTPR